MSESLSEPLPTGITLIEASAGTGKTFRIAHNVLRLVVEEGVGIDRIVVVTFTRAATRELSDRVRARLRDALAGIDARRRSQPYEPPDEVLGAWIDARPGAEGELELTRARLRQALVDFDEALISTIHGFCAEMLRRNAFESGASFDTELLGDAGALLDELVVDFWTRIMWRAEPEMLPALKAGGMNREALRHLAAVASNPDLPVIPPVQPASPPDLTAWRQAVARLQEAWERDEIARLLEQGPLCRRKNATYRVSFPSTATKNHLRDAARFLQRPVLSGAPPDGIDALRRSQIEAATYQGQQPPVHEFFEAAEAYVAVHRSLAPVLDRYVRSLKHQLVDEVRQALPERARRDNVRTYDDLLRELRDGLRHPSRGQALADAIRGQYQVALIDEFQDTDPVQWEVFRSVFTERLVLIGDPKQAIYRFRGADVHTYLAASTERDHLVQLDVNFRSDGRLVGALNHLFGRVRRPFAAEEPVYREVKPHHAQTRLVDDTRTPLEIRWLPRGSGARVYQGRLAGWFLDQTLPHVVADDIAAELARGTPIRTEAGEHPARPSDCAVLVYSHKQAVAQREALRRRGIGAVVRADRSVFDSWVRRELITVLSAVLTPGDATALRLALVSGLIGYTADDLAAMEGDPGRWNQVFADFRELSGLWVDRGFMAMFRDLVDRFGLRERLLARGDARAATDLAHLGELLHEAAARSRLGPGGLHRWLCQGGRDLAEDAATLRLATDADAVQVVTMHSAKGLEYPLVWCPALLKGGWLSELDKAHLCFHDRASDNRLTLDLGSPRHAAHLRQRDAERLQEDLRLIYVALTRARHRVVVYWGLTAWTPPLGYLLHQKPKDPDDQLVDAVNDRLRRASDAQLRTQLSELAQEHPGIGITDVDWGRGPAAPNPPAPAGPPDFEAEPLRRARGPDRRWRRSSFSALTRRVDPLAPSPELDRDAESEDERSVPPRSHMGQPVTLHQLRGGTDVGTALHAVLERLDFEDLDPLEDLVRSRLIAQGLHDLDVAVVAAALREALHTRLHAGGPRLVDLPRARRMDELAFTLPVCGGFSPSGTVSTRGLAQAFDAPDAPAGYAAWLRKLDFMPLSGFVTGAIDLVYEHDGRFYVADYKSNNLGPHVADYAPAALDHKVRASHYLLQAHLYLLALHRFLATRLRDYDYDTHIGGYQLLFLRGMHPDRGPGAGVFTDRPSMSLIARLDALFGGRP